MSETENDTRRFRLRFLIRECGRNIFKYRVEETIKPLALKDFLQDPENKQKLESLHEKHVITEKQYERLYPDSGAPSFEDFDITLLLVIIRTFCCSKRCDDPIWYKGSKPMANDFSREADLVRIRDHKNELEDDTRSEITTESFEEKWDDLCQVFLRLESSKDWLKDLFDRAKNMPHDAEKERELLIDFVTWKKMEQEFESGLDLIMTESKSLRFRLYSLIVDGGTRVFRHFIDDRIPPEHLQSTIASYHGILTILESKGVINASQHNLLYPSSGPPSSTSFDITLLAILLRNICGFNPNDPVWNSMNPPSPTNYSPEADIVRIRDHRNKLYHLPQTGDLPRAEFELMWEDITKILLRLNVACNEPLPNLQEEINTLKRKPVDPKREKEHQSVIEEWSKMDEKYESKVIQTILKHSVSEGAIERSKETVKDVLADKYFVKTSQFEEARLKLKENNIIVLNGAPGEGKTTVAKKLLAEVSQNERYIQLHTYADWDNVKLDNVDVVLIDDMFGSGVFDKEEYRKWQKHIPSIAAAVKNKHLFVVITSRSYILNEALDRMYVKSLFTQKNIVTLSSKQLLESEKEDILKNHFIKAAHKNPRIRRRTSKSEHSELVNDIIKLKLEGPEVCLMIGFPECARLFANNISLYEKGVLFFENPMTCVKSYMAKLLEDDDTFIAFFVLWAQHSKKLTSIELERPIHETSKDITDPICKLQFRPEDHVRNIRHVLRKHRGGFIHFDYKNEIFSFSHRVIQDSVGLVSYEINTTATIEFCDSAFIENFMRVDENMQDEETDDVCRRTIDFCPRTDPYEHPKCGNLEPAETRNTIRQNSSDQSDSEDSCTEFVRCVEPLIHLSPARYSQLSCRLGALLLPTFQGRSNSLKSYIRFRDLGFNVPLRYIDPSVFKTAIFDNEEFCKTFLGVMKKQNLLQSFLTVPTRALDTEFAEFRFLKHVNTEIRLPAYLIWIKEDVCLLANMCLDMMYLHFKPVLQEELRIALLISIKLGSQKLVEYLLKKGTEVDITHASLAIATENGDLLGLLLNKSNLLSEDETILHKVCKAGHADVVSKLLKDGASTKMVNTDCLSLIRSAVNGGHVETFKILLQYYMHQAEMNFEVEGNDMSLFHLVVPQQNVGLINVLLESGIRPKKVDNKGRTPFLHAICSNKIRIAERLLEISTEDRVQCIPDNDKNTPLYVSLVKYLKVEGRDRQVFFDIALRLCQFEDNVHLMNSKGDTAMRLACKNGLTEIVNELLKHEDPMKTEGTTLFHHFVTAGDLDSIETLLKSDMDPNIHDKHHRTPFMLANALGKMSVIGRLQGDQRIVSYNKEMGIVTVNAGAERTTIEVDTAKERSSFKSNLLKPFIRNVNMKPRHRSSPPSSSTRYTDELSPW